MLIDDTRDALEKIELLGRQPLEQMRDIEAGSSLMHEIDVAPKLVGARDAHGVPERDEHLRIERLENTVTVPIGSRFFRRVIGGNV